MEAPTRGPDSSGDVFLLNTSVDSIASNCQLFSSRFHLCDSRAVAARGACAVGGIDGGADAIATVGWRPAGRGGHDSRR
jgi:hypothetical protein